MIDITKLHVGLKANRFEYASTLDINEIETAEPTHRIKTKKRGRGHRWAFIGLDDGALEYESEAAAREDVARLREWASS